MFTTSKIEGTTLVTDEANTNPRKLQKTIHSWFEGTISSPQKFARTTEKWKTTSLANSSGEAWLIVSEDQSYTDFDASFNCRIWRQFEDWISSIKGFNQTWIKEGSKRLLLNAAKEHAEGKPHKKAICLHLQDKGLTIRERSETMHQNSGFMVRDLNVRKQKDFEPTNKKFVTAYFVVKEELPITKFTKILGLEEKHSVALGEAYRKNMLGSMMIDFIERWLSNEMKKELEEADYSNILIDGSIDASIVEKEAIFAITFDLSPPGIDKIGAKVSSLDVADLHGADVNSVLECIKTSVW